MHEHILAAAAKAPGMSPGDWLVVIVVIVIIAACTGILGTGGD